MSRALVDGITRDILKVDGLVGQVMRTHGMLSLSVRNTHPREMVDLLMLKFDEYPIIDASWKALEQRVAQAVDDIKEVSEHSVDIQ
jgi:hypothetical protein